MKVAIPVKNNVVDDHFGHCEYFKVFDVENNSVVSSEKLETTEGCGCKSNLVSELKQQGVSVMLAGNMGQGAYNKLVNANISVIRGCKGSVDTLINDYLLGNIKDQLIMCSEHNHNDGHVCNH